MKRNHFILPALALALAVAAGAPAPAFAGGAPPTLSKSFSPAAITDGGTTTLTFTLTNPPGDPAASVGFTDTLPAGLVVENPPNLVTGGGPPPGSIPTLSAGMLALLAVALAGGALLLVRRS